MKKEILAVGIIVLLLTIAFSGCVKENTVTAEEIKERFLQASKSVTSYRYSSDMAGTMTTIKESKTNTTGIAAVLTGEVDIFNKELKGYYNITYTGKSNEEHVIIYFVDNTSYYGNETNGNITWHGSYFPQAWNVYSLLDQLVLFLKNETWQFNNTELKRLSDETVENVDCYVLQFTGFKNESAGYNLTGYSYTEYEINYWITKDTNLLKKGYVKSTSDSSGIYSFGGGNRSIYVSETDIIFYDYNVPLNIELPPEAKNSWM